MKTILALAILFILTGIGYAASIQRIETEGYRDAYWSDVICLEGYKFVVVKSARNNGIAVTQIFQRYADHPQPMECK